MADDRHDVRIRDEFLRGRNGLRGIALIIQGHQFQPVAGKDLALRIGLLDRQQRPIEHVLAMGRLVAGQGSDKPNLDDRTLPPASCKENHQEPYQRMPLNV